MSGGKCEKKNLKKNLKKKKIGVQVRVHGGQDERREILQHLLEPRERRSV